MYVIYHKDSFKRVGKLYATERAAKGQRTKMLNHGLITANYIVGEFVFWAQNEPLVETTNIMSGATIQIPQSQKGTFLDPGTETYWSM